MTANPAAPRERDMNMELLRLVTMALIVVLHLDVYLLEEPGHYAAAPATHYAVLLLKSLTIVGVNVFVLLSGWYGIRLRWSRFWGLWFQVLFFLVVGLAADYVLTLRPMPAAQLPPYLLLMQGGEYGFFQSYLLLYLFAPLLNLFAEQTPRRQQALLVGVLLGLQVLWGCLSWGYVYFGNGYSALSFMMVYLLARLARASHAEQWLAPWQWAGLYLLLAVAGSALALAGGRSTALGNLAYSYASPVVIGGAVALVALFARLRVRSAAVGRVAKYCFAIYLLHMNPLVLPHIIGLCQRLGIGSRLATFPVGALLVCAAIFAAAIALDAVRLRLWKALSASVPLR